MTPPPPALRGDRLTRWKPEHLFSIVKHGIKFTGMPAWPAQQRDDEVWAVVAFLTRLPNMDTSEYGRLVRNSGLGGSPARDSRLRNDDFPADTSISPSETTGSPQVPQPVRDVCWRCHGTDGTGGDDGAFPSLAGQRAAYLLDALRAFADRTRFSATMAEIAARLDAAEMWEIAAYYEQLASRSPAPPRDSAAVARGEAIARRGAPDRNVPACIECHGPAVVPKNPAYPRLAGQHARYLTLQLELLKQRRRGGSPRVNLMHTVVDRLDVSDMRDAALYYASTSHDAPEVSQPASLP